MSGPRSLVGRKHELAQLQELLTTVRGGAGASLLVRGEPGVGRSAPTERMPEFAERVYPKLGISSRKELRVAFASG
jgi:Cdc6-like AAA superfamily ATPase